MVLHLNDRGGLPYRSVFPPSLPHKSTNELTAESKQPINIGINSRTETAESKAKPIRIYNLKKVGRNAIIEEMKAQCNTSLKGDISDLSPRPKPKATAPRYSVVRFDPARKKDLLGPGGVVIRQMEDRFNVSLDLTQEGKQSC